MSIYDKDFVPEPWEQSGVTEPVAEAQAIEESSKPNEDRFVDPSNMVDSAPTDHIAGAGKESQDVSEKEYNFRALRESIAQEKAEREAERRRYEQELYEMKYHLSQQLQAREPEKSALDGLDNSDLMTVEAYKKAQYEQQRRYQEEITSLRYENLENRARLQHSDYNEVMEKYSIPLLRENRDFARAFQAAENPAEFAYTLGKMQMGTQQPVPAEQHQQENIAERIVSNARKPGTLSSARGGQPSLSKADYYASMSDDDFAKLVSKNLTQI